MAKKSATSVTTLPLPQATLAVTPATMAWNELWIDHAANTRQIPHTEAQIADLMRSIAANGQAQRVLVAESYTPMPEGSTYAYQLVAGYGRAEALHRLYGDTAEILVDILASGTNPLDLDMLSAAENYARVDPSPVDKALMLKRVMKQYGLNVKAAGERLGFDKTHSDALSKLWGEEVTERPEIQNMLASGAVGLRAVSDIMRESNPAWRNRLLDEIQEGRMTGTQALDKLGEWRRREAEKAAENPEDPTQEPEADKRKKKKVKPLTMRTLVMFLEELEPVADPNDPDAEVEWDGVAVVANLLREKVIPGKMSVAKFAAAANAALYGEAGEGNGGEAAE
jgi:ParB-like chromosome segregation protein Spo0J